MKKTRIMYIECKGDGISGPARIGRVSYTKSGKSLYYRERLFQSLSGGGFKANYFDAESGEHYWISGCKKDGTDRLCPGTVSIDEDVREEYWTEIRQTPEKKNRRSFRCAGKYGH
ncbi:MAG: 1-deoxy-D-xylulose-5-phosphate synthase [Acidobacteriia bacterium]|nr:1-deoxy-D-xylulose-5-phosphate synthase [Terriglobia bacterium]